MATRAAPRVLVVADQDLVSETVSEALGARGFEIQRVGFPGGARVRQGLRAMALARRPAAALVISDLVDLVEVREVREVVRELPVPALVLTNLRPAAAWGAVIEAGAVGVLPLTATLDDLSRALAALIRGRPVMPPEMAASVVEQWRAVAEEDRQLSERIDTLTPRELEVLVQLSEGWTVKRIAASVNVSEGTVRSQVKSILRKLGVSSQLAGAAAYRRWGETARRVRRRGR